MKLYLFFSLILLHTSLSARDQKERVKLIREMKKITQKIQQKEVRALLRSFVTSSSPSRLVGTKGHARARDFLKNELKQKAPSAHVRSLSFTPDLSYAENRYREDLRKQVPKSSPDYPKWKKFTDHTISFVKNLKGVQGENILFEKKGVKFPQEILLIATHYDSVSLNTETGLLDQEISSPGADDNASGVVAGLILAKILESLPKSFPLPKTVRILFSDFQEFWALGSKAYVKENKDDFFKLSGKDQVKGVICVEMIGHDGRLKDKKGIHGNAKLYLSRPEQETWKRESNFASRIKKGVRSLASLPQLKIDPIDERIGDTVPFRSTGVPTIGFSHDRQNDLNSRQHTPNDFIETLNIKSLTKRVRWLVAAALLWAYDLD